MEFITKITGFEPLTLNYHTESFDEAETKFILSSEQIATLKDKHPSFRVIILHQVKKESLESLKRFTQAAMKENFDTKIYLSQSRDFFDLFEIFNTLQVKSTLICYTQEELKKRQSTFKASK